jgi:histidinol-phosphatase
VSAAILAADLELARQLADEARSISLTSFRGRFEKRRKADGSIVTSVDEAVERAIRARLKRERPDDAMLGEEFGETGRGPRRWVVDAIDGTSSFAAGTDGWGTLIALEIDGEVAVGVCDMTPIDRRYFAASGQGAFCVERGGESLRLAVSAAAELRTARCFVPGPKWLPGADGIRAAALAARTRPVEPDDHPALRVAAGELEIAAFFMGGPWDVAAPAIVVREAGGRFSDLHGGRSIARGGGLFSNGAIHAAALAVVGRGPGPAAGR